MICERCDIREATGRKCKECYGCQQGYPCWEELLCQYCIDNYEPSDKELMLDSDNHYPLMTELQLSHKEGTR